MTDVSLEVLNRRAVIDAVHAEAAKIGADGEKLLDSRDFYNRATALDPDAPGYRRQVQEMVAAAAPRQQSVPQASQQAAPTARAAPAGPAQWTLADVEAASRRGGPQAVGDAMDAGHLADLGYGPRRRR